MNQQLPNEHKKAYLCYAFKRIKKIIDAFSYIDEMEVPRILVGKIFDLLDSAEIMRTIEFQRINPEVLVAVSSFDLVVSDKKEINNSIRVKKELDFCKILENYEKNELENKKIENIFSSESRAIEKDSESEELNKPEIVIFSYDGIENIDLLDRKSVV